MSSGWIYLHKRGGRMHRDEPPPAWRRALVLVAIAALLILIGVCHG